jgi:hypothetical protein
LIRWIVPIRTTIGFPTFPSAMVSRPFKSL